MMLRRVLWILMGVAAACYPAQAASDPSIRPLPVPAATIYPGSVIDTSQLTERTFQTSPQSLAGVAIDAGQIIGKETSRRLAAGRPIPLAALGKPLTVRRGSAATAFYQEEGFSISTPVVVLADGSVGDIIDARATPTGAIIQVLISPGGELTVIGE